MTPRALQFRHYSNYSVVARLLVSLAFGILIAAVLARVVDTFFYVCWMSGALTAIAAWLLMSPRSFHERCSSLDQRGLIRFFCTTLATTLVTLFLTLGPLNIDRSFSVWMLRNLSERNSSLSVQETEDLASSFFSSGGGEIRRRVLEQVDLGNIEIRNGMVTLTSAGHRVSQLNNWISRFYGLNPIYAQ